MRWRSLRMRYKSCGSPSNRLSTPSFLQASFIKGSVNGSFKCPVPPRQRGSKLWHLRFDAFYEEHV